MNKLLNDTFNITKKQWLLVLFSTILTVIFQMDYGVGDENFGLILLLAIPYLFFLIFDFCLTKFILHKREHPKAGLMEILNVYFDYAPKLILPMLGLMALVVLVMIVLITMVYGIFAIFGISNTKSIFESDPTDLNYILFYLAFNFVMGLFTFQAVLYFKKSQSFFGAFKNSVGIAKKNLPFIISLSLVSFAIMSVTNLLGNDMWYKNVLIGIINSLQYYLFAVVVLLYFERNVERH